MPAAYSCSSWPEGSGAIATTADASSRCATSTTGSSPLDWKCVDSVRPRAASSSESVPTISTTISPSGTRGTTKSTSRLCPEASRRAASFGR